MNFCILTLRFLSFDYCSSFRKYYILNEIIFLVMKFFLDFSPALAIYVYTFAPVKPVE